MMAQELATEKPADPLTWLGDFLKSNAAQGNAAAAQAAAKKEAAARAKADAAAGAPTLHPTSLLGADPFHHAGILLGTTLCRMSLRASVRNVRD